MPPRSSPCVSSSERALLRRARAERAGEPAPKGRARLGSARAQLDDAAEGIRAVGDRAGAARDLDALERRRVDEGRARADAPLGRDPRAVDQHERAARRPARARPSPPPGPRRWSRCPPRSRGPARRAPAAGREDRPRAPTSRRWRAPDSSDGAEPATIVTDSSSAGVISSRHGPSDSVSTRIGFT